MLEDAVPRARHALGSLLRLASRPWRQWTISPDTATTLFGCGFGATGWHHIRRTLLEFDENPALTARDSTMWRYLSGFRPTSISLLAGVGDEPPLPLFEYPWGTFSGSYVRGPKDPIKSRFCGPSEPAFIEDEFARTLALYASLRQTGYQPDVYPNAYIGGTWLVAVDGQRRFVVMQGNHRMAVLAHMGLTHIAVRNVRQARAAVYETELLRWEHVRSGQCSVEHARRVFQYFFQHTGWQVAEAIG
jgi:hypothetical protein